VFQQPWRAKGRDPGPFSRTDLYSRRAIRHARAHGQSAMTTIHSPGPESSEAWLPIGQTARKTPALLASALRGDWAKKTGIGTRAGPEFPSFGIGEGGQPPD